MNDLTLCTILRRLLLEPGGHGHGCQSVLDQSCQINEEGSDLFCLIQLK